jgi:hypothetical protein
MESEIRDELLEYLLQDLVNYIIVPYIIWTDEMNEEACEKLWLNDVYRSARNVINKAEFYNQWNSRNDYQFDVVKTIRKRHFENICPRCLSHASAWVYQQRCIVCERQICTTCIKKDSSHYCGCANKEIANMKVTKSNKRHSKYNFVDMN